MVITPLRNQTLQGRDLVKVKLEMNTSAISLAQDQLFSAMEAGQGSFLMRDHLDTVLHTYAMTRADIANFDYSWKKLRQCQSIKDKIAFVTGSVNAHDMGAVAAASTTTIDDAQLMNSLNNLIETLRKDLIEKENFTESWIIRHAAFNNFEAKLSVAEQKTLSAISDKMKKLAETSDLDQLAETMHFQKESDAQQIVKIEEAMAICAEQGIDVDAKLIEQFDVLKQKIKPIKDLDKHYKHLMNTLNMVHRNAKTGMNAMVTPSQKTKLLKVLEDLGTNEQAYIFDAIGQAENPKMLDSEFLNLKKDSRKFAEVLRANNITAREFETHFFSYFTFVNVEKARTDFDKQKADTFPGARLKAYETDTNAWRGLAREKILALHANMTSGPNGVMVFGSDADYNIANSYFEKFKDIFFADEKDAIGPDGGHYRQMRDVLAAIMRRRIPALGAPGQRRFGVALRRIIARISDPQILKGLEHWYKKADDAELLAMIIMAQNESTNMMFYHDKNPFVSTEGGIQRLAKNMSRAELGREAVRDVISKPANTFFRLGEGALKGTLKGANKALSKTGRFVTWATTGVLGPMNRQIEKSKGKWYMIPGYAVWLASRPLEAIANKANSIFNYTDAEGNKAIDNAQANTVEMLRKGFNDQSINNVYQGFTHAFEGITSFLGKTTARVGQAGYDKIDTGKKRDVLSAFFEAAQKEEDLTELMQSSDLANMLNLKERGPYIFDEDGRVTTVNKVSTKKEYAEDAAGAHEYMKDQSKKIMEDINAAFKDYADRQETEYETNQDALAGMTPADANYDKIQKNIADITIRQQTLAGKQTITNEMVAAMQAFLRNADANSFNTEITRIHRAIKTAKDRSDKTITDANIIVKAQEKIKETSKKSLDEVNAKLAKLNPADKGYATLTAERLTAETERNTTRTALRSAEDAILTSLAAKQKLERKRDSKEQEVKELKKKAERKVEYNDAMDKLGEVGKDLAEKRRLLSELKNDERNAADNRNKNKNNNSPEKTLLTNAIRDLEAQERRLQNIAYNGLAVADGVDYEADLVTAKAELADFEDQITDNETNHKQLIKDKDAAQDAYDKAVQELAKIDAQLTSKMSGDKGYAELVADRATHEAAIASADAAISAQQKIIDKEAQAGKVHADFYKMSTRMDGFAKNAKHNADTNMTTDPAAYMKQVQKLLKEFNGYIISKNIAGASAQTTTQQLVSTLATP